MPKKLIYPIFIFLNFLFVSTIVQAANPFGFVIGKATYDEVYAQLSPQVDLEEMGINKFSGGKMIQANQPSNLGYGGLSQLKMIFDNNNKLTAVVMRLDKGKGNSTNGGFMYVLDELGKKYLPVFKNLDNNDKMSAGFTTTAQDVHIRMISLQSSMDKFDLQYLSDDFWQRYEYHKKSGQEFTKTLVLSNNTKEIF